MPNYVKNVVTIEGSNKDIANVLELLKNKNLKSYRGLL